jgi:excisionase family DNA binding protein
MNPDSSPTGLNSTEPLTYSVAEAAAALGVSPATIYRLLYRRVLKPVPGIRHKRISRKQIHALAQGADSPSSRR